MLLVTGAVALSRKMVDEKAKRREAKQGNLKVGDSHVAKRAFASQASVNGSDPTNLRRVASDIKYEHPNHVTATSPDATSPAIDSPRPEFKDVRHSSKVNVASPVQSERGIEETWSPYTEGVSTPSDQQSLHPPPYTTRTRSRSNPTRPFLRSTDTDAASMTSFDTSSGTLRSTNSNGTHALRIKTIGSDLKSGFPYHDELFELNVHPQKWTAFTTQVIDAAKLSASDQAGTWVSATAVALTGAIGTSVMLGRSMNRTAQEKKIKAGLASSESKLGETLKLWNDEYFSPRGLFVHLELSESAMKNPGQQSKALRKGVYLYSKPEDRERKREERKFVIVVTKLDEDGEPLEALKELEIEEKRNDRQIPEVRPGLVEIGSSDMPNGVCELPTNQTGIPVELPAELASSPKTHEPPSGYVEVSSDNTLLLEKMHLHDGEGEYQQDNYVEGYPPQQAAGRYGYMSAEQEKIQLEATRQAQYDKHDSTYGRFDPRQHGVQSYPPQNYQMQQVEPSYQENNSSTVIHPQPPAMESYPSRAENIESTTETAYAPPSYTAALEDTSNRDTTQSELRPSERYDPTSSSREQPEAASTNPYALQSAQDSNVNDYNNAAVKGTQDQSNSGSQLMRVKTPPGVTLFDGADWDNDDDFT